MFFGRAIVLFALLAFYCGSFVLLRVLRGESISLLAVWLPKTGV
jgi:hypothetical protein